MKINLEWKHALNEVDGFTIVNNLDNASKRLVDNDKLVVTSW